VTTSVRPSNIAPTTVTSVAAVPFTVRRSVLKSADTGAHPVANLHVTNSVTGSIRWIGVDVTGGVGTIHQPRRFVTWRFTMGGA
jgi:hypothetical protein